MQADDISDKALMSALKTQMGILRRLFREVDVQKEGHAKISTLTRRICEDVFINMSRRRKYESVELLLKTADPHNTGFVEFGRLTRLIRAGGTQQAAQSASGDEDLRVRFRGVDVCNKQMSNRLRDTQPLARMAMTARTSSILGDSSIPAPWAQIGDDARMDHITRSLHVERRDELKNTLLKNSENAQLSQKQLSSALHTFDPFIHDAEVTQYYRCMVPQQPKRPRPSSARAPPGVSVSDFFTRYGQNVIASPAMRSSAEFTLKWDQRSRIRRNLNF